MGVHSAPHVVIERHEEAEVGVHLRVVQGVVPAQARRGESAEGGASRERRVWMDVWESQGKVEKLPRSEG